MAEPAPALERDGIALLSPTQRALARLGRTALRFERLRRAIVDVARCERSRTLQQLHELDRVRRYEIDLRRLPPITDVFVISYPKSGRTWHRFLVGNYLAALWGRPKSEAASVEDLTASQPGTRTRYDHNGANFVDAIAPDHPAVANPALWSGRKVIFLVREPKDVLVSAWHHARWRSNSYRGPIADFVRSRYAGIDKLLVAQNRWWASRERASAHLVLSYERMHADLAGVLRDTLRFVGWPVDEPGIANAVAASTFAAMRDAEREKSVDHGSLQPTAAAPDQADERARKVRSGKVVGHREHLSADDVAFVDRRVAALGNPFAPWSADRGHAS
jgi:hypothetical protein